MESALTNAASQTNFTPLDWVIVAVYLVLSVSIAFFVKRYAGNMTNFVSAGRAVGTWLGIATLTGTEMGLITVMYSAQKGFKTGFAAFHIGVIAGFVAFLIGVTGFIVVRLREHKVLTIPEYYEKRYGRRTRILGGIMLAFGGLLNMGLFLKVGAMFIVGITGMVPDSGAVNAVMIVLLALVLVYTVIGGMISVVITDYIQFVILSVGILVTGWLAIEHVGWDNLFETVRTHKGEAGFNPVAAKSDFGWEYVGWMFFLGIVNCALWPTAVARALAMESTTALKRQYTWSSISFAIRIIIPNLLGVCAFVFVITKAPDLQQLFSPADADVKAVDNLYAMPIFLGRILPAGLIGLITAAMIAAFMSTHDGYLLCWSSVITQDIIAPLFKERLDNPTRIKITRILIVLIGLYILYWGLFYTGEEDI
ncbi:MAG: sodium:solute symporter family protein, partial [Verrucomicrobiota bacterium]|nr:sodium:solute symporter family protein [Verrucomicrobiota bacterium]MDP7291768.1 sodium:solute symporter family protein [Verrucomicrobiota bacterium]